MTTRANNKSIILIMLPACFLERLPQSWVNNGLSKDICVFLVKSKCGKMGKRKRYIFRDQQLASSTTFSGFKMLGILVLTGYAVKILNAQLVGGLAVVITRVTALPLMASAAPCAQTRPIAGTAAPVHFNVNPWGLVEFGLALISLQIFPPILSRSFLIISSAS